MIFLIFAIMTLLFVGIGVLVGLKRGFLRSTLRLVLLIISVPIAALISGAIALYSAGIVIDTVQGSGALGSLSQMIEASPTLALAINSIAAAASAPALFVIIFILVSVVLFAVYKITASLLAKPIDGVEKLTGKALNKILGGVSGAVCGFIIMGAVLVPVEGFSILAYDSISSLSSASSVLGESSAEIEEINDTYISQIANNLFVRAAYTLGGRQTFNSLTTIKAGDVKTTLSAETGTLIDVLSKLSAFTDVDMTKYTAVQSEALAAAVGELEKSALFAPIAAELLSSACTAWAQGEDFMGMAPPSDTEEAYSIIIEAAQDSFVSSSEETIIVDLLDISRVFATLVKYNAFEKLGGEEGMIEVLADKALIAEVVSILYSNERLAPIVPAVVKAGVTILAENIGIPENAGVVYTNMMDEFASAITKNRDMADDERAKLLAQEILVISGNYEADIDDVTATLLAVGMVSDFGDLDNVSALQVEEFLYVFVKNLMRSQENMDSSRDLFPAGSALVSAGASSGNVLGNSRSSYRGDQVSSLDWWQELISSMSGETPDTLEARYPGASSVGQIGSIIDSQSGIGASDTLTVLMGGGLYSTFIAPPMFGVMSDSFLNYGTAPVAPSQYTSAFNRVDYNPVGIPTVDSLIASIPTYLPSGGNTSAESNSVANVISSLPPLVTILSGGNSGITGGLGMVGQVLDQMNQSATFGGGLANNLVQGILQSGAVTTGLGITSSAGANIANQIISSSSGISGESDYSSTLGQLSVLVDYTSVLLSSSSTDYQKQQAVERMINNLDDRNLSMLRVFTTPQMLESLGVSPSMSSAISSIINDVLSRLLNFKNSGGDYTSEASAVNAVIDVAFSAMRGASVDIINTAWVETIAYSSVMSDIMTGSLDPYGLSLNTGVKDQIHAVISACIRNYPSNATKYMNIAAFFGVSISN